MEVPPRLQCLKNLNMASELSNPNDILHEQSQLAITVSGLKIKTWVKI